MCIFHRLNSINVKRINKPSWRNVFMFIVGCNGYVYKE